MTMFENLADKKRFKGFDNRYKDRSKFKQKIEDFIRQGDIYISSEDDYDIWISNSDEEIIKYKKFIEFCIPNIGKLDMIARKYMANGNNVNYDIKGVEFEDNNIIKLDCFTTEHNSSFWIVFTYQNDDFILESIGMDKNIPKNWE